MKSLTGLGLVLALVVSSSAHLSQPTVDSTLSDPTSDDHGPILTVHFDRLFPIFDVNFSSESDDSDGDIKISVGNSSQKQPPQEDEFAVSLMEVFSFNTHDNKDNDSGEASDKEINWFPFVGEKMVPSSSGILDLSRRNLTGEELATELISRQRLGQPVTTLILSNSRVDGLSEKSFEPVKDTLQELQMDNCTVSLKALSDLSNLQLLNLSNNGLTGFYWYPRLQATLEVLDLSHNKLESICREFAVLTSLRELDLSYNRIMAIEEFSVLHLPSLEVLFLTRNCLKKAMLHVFNNLKRVDLDWNYLERFGPEVRLPTQLQSVKLSSNLWSCSCDILEIRDMYRVLDIDTLRCDDHYSYHYCDDRHREFLPSEDGPLVANVTRDSIGHVGCHGLMEQYYRQRSDLQKEWEHEPEKLVILGVFWLACVLALVGTCLLCRSFFKKKSFRQTWLKIQQIPELQICKVQKPSEVSYIKINSSRNIQA